jgi:Lon protease-like protein
MGNPFQPKLADLPAVLPIFPLAGSLLLPGARLPLNIFEPRYLSMTRAALAAPLRLIGMVQPLRPGGFAGGGEAPEGGKPQLHATGCAGRIVSFEETDDGRYRISLSGLCRFRIAEEIEGRDGFRQIRPDWQNFTADLERVEGERAIDRPRLQAALKGYFDMKELSTDWQAIERAADSILVNSLAMALPLDPTDKQALLEADNDDARAKALTAILEAALRAPEGAATMRH